MHDFDYIVIGAGGIGSAACYWLARACPDRVLALEQFSLGHDHGASQDHSRIIRLSYHDERYVPLARAAYQAWAEVEAEARQQIVVKTGGVDLAPDDPDGRQSVEAYTTAMDRHGVPYQELSAAQAMERFPQFRMRPGEVAVYQADTGLVDARRANAVHVALARYHGATIVADAAVSHLSPSDDCITVESTAGRFVARKGVVIAADAWTNRLLEPLGTSIPLVVSQEQVTYWATSHLAEFSPDQFPIWAWHGPHLFYGFPVYGEVATKAAEDGLLNFIDLDTRSYAPDLDAVARLEAFLQERIPGFTGPTLYTKTCLYTMPPDRHFVIDRLPQDPRIVMALGAGHAFKFATLIGRILRDLAVRGETSYPITGFDLTRAAITDPQYQGSLRL
jgi:sarcosine oxidase